MSLSSSILTVNESIQASSRSRVVRQKKFRTFEKVMASSVISAVVINSQSEFQSSSTTGCLGRTRINQMREGSTMKSTNAMRTSCAKKSSTITTCAKCVIAYPTNRCYRRDAAATTHLHHQSRLEDLRYSVNRRVKSLEQDRDLAPGRCRIHP